MALCKKHNRNRNYGWQSWLWFGLAIWGLCVKDSTMMMGAIIMSELVAIE